MDKRVSLETSQDVENETLTADGMEQRVDDRTLFCTPAPLAASTVARDTNRAKQFMMADSKGSFLDDMSRLSLQSMSAMDITDQLMKLNFNNSRGDTSTAVRSSAGDSGPDLIQFSANSNVMNMEDQRDGELEHETSKSDSLTDVSSRSSMGLIPTDMLDELSASVLPMNTPKAAPAPPRLARQKPDTTRSSSRGRTGDSAEWSDSSKQESKQSTDWSDSSRHDSKQDSKDLPMGRSHLDTVKKKPQAPDSQFAPRPLGVMRGAVTLFAGGILDNVQEGNELDHSVYDVELGADDLKQLDADFSDLEGDKSSLEGGLESGDEDFGFDEEPLCSLPARGQHSRTNTASGTISQNQSESFRDSTSSHANTHTSEEQEKTLEAERIEEADNRVGEGRESDEEDGGPNQMASSRSGFGLDSRYFHKTPMPFAGDGEDAEVTSSRSSLGVAQQQRGAAEGEHLLTKLRRQFMSGDGSEIDTDDELEAARKSLAVAERPESQGADGGDGSRYNLPMPVGVEDKERPDDDSHNSFGSSQSHSQRLFSYLTRQSGEGDASYSPVPWDGGGGGDGSSGPESDDGRRFAGQGQGQAARHRFAVPHSQASQQPLVSSVSKLSETGRESELLQPDFFLPSSTPQALQDSELGATQTLEGSTFNVEDILKPGADLAFPRIRDGRVVEARLDASGFNADDNRGNPFEDDFAVMQSSFGSFGLGPDDGTDSHKANASSSRSDQADQTEKLPSIAVNSSATPSLVMSAHKSGSFDGPFRKPRAPAEKKLKKQEPVNSSPASVSSSCDQWKDVGFPDMDGEGDNLEKELKELGISFGDDDFQTAESAQAMLAADEKQFEEDHKFSEHHQLAVAAEGLSWEADEDHLSGYLGGEDKPEHLEVSIGTYIAARTETLGTLGGDPNIPRPQFGKPVWSPPHNRAPVKFMSPPASASTSCASLPSRTEGEGNEDGDETIVSGDTTMLADDLESDAQPPPKKVEQNAEATLREELSSLILDLTNTSSFDMSMEDALSMSTVLNFVKNHNFGKSSDFASAILKLSHQKKQHGAKKGDETRTIKSNESRTTSEKRQSEFKMVGEKSLPKDGRVSKEHVSKGVPAAMDSSTSSGTSSASPSSTLGASPHQKGSRLPVRLGSNVTGSAEKKRERTQSAHGREQLAPGKLSKSRSVSQLPSELKLHEEFDEVSSKGQGKDEGSGQRMGNVSQTGRSLEAPAVTDARDRSGTHRESKQLPGRDSEGGYQRQILSNSRREQSTSSRDQRRIETSQASQAAAPAAQIYSTQGSLPQNIPASASRKRQTDTRRQTDASCERTVWNDGRGRKSCSSSQASFRTDQRPGDDGESQPYKPTFQTPATKLSASSSAQSSRNHQVPQNVPTSQAQYSNQGSPRSAKYNHHVPDGMENSAPATHHRGDDLCVSREEAVGTEDVELMESRQFNLVDDPSSHAAHYHCTSPQFASEQVQAQRLPNSSSDSTAFPSAQLTQKGQNVSEKPALLTGTSLLNTEFAQKYLTPGDGGKPAGDLRELSHLHPQPVNQQVFRQPQSAGRYSSQSVNNKQPPRQPQTSEGCHIPVSANSVQSCTAQHTSRQQQPANTTAAAAGLDETAASMYYELNEDLQHTTVMGDMPESFVHGSFWGKSPLYQSTPAIDVGRLAAVTMMASKLDERELTTPSNNLVTPRVQRQLIDVQRKVAFPEFCCLGVSQKTAFPITNRTAVGVACRLRLVQLQHNEKPINPELQSPFEFKHKLSIGPGATEELPLLFVPKRPGEHVALVEVMAQSMNPTLEPTTSVVHIHAVAEVPNIQIAPSVEVLDYGDVMWGASVLKTIKLRNLKRASLPVRLSIWSSSSVWHCFTFDSSDNASDMSIISMSSRPESLGRNVQTVILPGCENEAEAKVLEIQLFCRPPTKELNRALAERPADKIEARVDVEVDTPVQYLPPLASLTVRATIGMPRLLIPPSHMSLSFKTQPNKNIQECVVLNNSGNISMDLALSVTTFPECFTVSPARVTIKPGCQAEISVIFCPLESGVYKYQSLLLLDIEPEGPSYEIPMEAHVVHPAPPPSRGLSPSILTSKSFLSFTGVALNQTKSLTLRLFNKDSYKAEYATVEIRGATDCFKLVTVSGEWQQRCEVVIDPKEKVTLTVIFCPTAVRGYSGKLVIKMQNPQSHSTKYSIPLAGYGGRSVLTLSGACLTNSGQRWLELGPLKSGHNIMREVVLTNSGVRAAFVRAAAYYDMPCKQQVHPGRVAVEPNNFVLPPGNSLKVVVAISPSQREVDLVKERKEVVAVVRFQHGDEVMRQKYQRSLSREGGRADQHSWQAAFSQQFANEAQDTVIQEGRTVPDSPDDSAAFFHQLSSQCVALLADPQPDRPVAAVPVSFAPHSHQSSQLSSPASSVHSSQSREEKKYDSTGQFLVPSRPDDADMDWTVKPDHLTLTVGETNQKMLQLINFSRIPLSFELSWPSNSVVPEPQKGEMKPRSSTSVDVWLHIAWQKRQAELPWAGDLVISCNGQQKCVRVHIQNAPQPPVLAVSSPHSSLSSVSSSASKRMSRESHHGAPGRSLQVASTNIHFPRAKVNEQYESVLELTNISTEAVHWKLSAFAPPYVKGADETNTVQRVGYSVFTIAPVSGDLLPRETVKVPVKFCPKTKGTYNQHWEVEYQPLTTGRTVSDVATTKISLTAEASSRESLLTVKQASDPVVKEKEKVSHRTPLQEKQPNTMPASSDASRTTPQELLLLNPDVFFSDTKVGQATQVKVEFKNSLDQNVQLEVTTPKPPFKVKHMTFGITKRRFLKYPIEFRPTVPGKFEDTMVFHAPQLKKSFTVRLVGQGIE